MTLTTALTTQPITTSADHANRGSDRIGSRWGVRTCLVSAIKLPLVSLKLIVMIMLRRSCWKLGLPVACLGCLLLILAVGKINFEKELGPIRPTRLNQGRMISSQQMREGFGNITSITTTHFSFRRKSSRCPDLMPPADLPETQTFQPFRGRTTMFVFAAYYDERYNIIRIIAIALAESSETGFCQLWYRDADGDVLRMGSASSRIIPDGHGKRYYAFFVTCSLPDSGVPYAVSVVSTECEKPTNLLKIQNTKKVDYSKLTGFGVCPGPFHGYYNRVDQMIENLETNRMLGATKFTLYNYRVSDQVYNVLKPYIKEGIVELVQWPIPIHGTKEIHYFGQLALLNDCLYRNYQKVKYVAVVDLDEYLVPKRHENWTALLHDLNKRGIHAASYMFRNVFFNRWWEDDAEMAKDSLVKKLNLEVLLKTKRYHQVFPPYDRSKVIVEIRQVQTVGIHFVWEYVSWFGCHVLSESDGLLHHYRNWGFFFWGSKMKKDFLIDTTMYKFKRELVHRVQKVRKDLGLL